MGRAGRLGPRPAWPVHSGPAYAPPLPAVRPLPFGGSGCAGTWAPVSITCGLGSAGRERRGRRRWRRRRWDPGERSAARLAALAPRVRGSEGQVNCAQPRALPSSRSFPSSPDRPLFPSFFAFPSSLLTHKYSSLSLPLPPSSVLSMFILCTYISTKAMHIAIRENIIGVANPMLWWFVICVM